eukprot:800808_1
MFVVSSEIFTTTMYFPLWHHQTANNQARQSSLSSTAINQARQLIEGLSKYNAIINDNETHNEIHISNIEEILNQFEYVLQYADQNQLLAYIFDKLKHCDISKCAMFRRNARNRPKYSNKTSIYELYQINDDHLIAKCQLMDKIHCFCHHSYDDGNRLSIGIEEQNVLHQCDPNESQFTTVKRILSEKNTNRKNPIMSQIRNRMCTKFHKTPKLFLFSLLV